MKTITLPIKEPWYSMILRGEKTEEYREIKDFYTSRFANICGRDRNTLPESLAERPERDIAVTFRNGYAKESPSFEAVCELTTGKGNALWGAKKGKTYYILKVQSLRGIAGIFEEALPEPGEVAVGPSAEVERAKESLEDFFSRNRKALVSAGSGLYVNAFGDMEYGEGNITNRMIDEAIENVQILYEAAGGKA